MTNLFIDPMISNISSLGLLLVLKIIENMFTKANIIITTATELPEKKDPLLFPTNTLK